MPELKLIAGVAQLIERRVAIAKVVGLSPITRSTIFKFFYFISQRQAGPFGPGLLIRACQKFINKFFYLVFQLGFYFSEASAFLFAY